MKKYVCDLCDAEIEATEQRYRLEIKAALTPAHLGGYDLCDYCKETVEAFIMGNKQDKPSEKKPDSQFVEIRPSGVGCEDGKPNLDPVIKAVQDVLRDTGSSLDSKIHMCSSCDTDKYYDNTEVTDYHFIKLQHAYIDYMKTKDSTTE